MRTHSDSKGLARAWQLTGAKRGGGVASAAATGEYPDGRPPANGIGCWTPCSTLTAHSSFHSCVHSAWHRHALHLTCTTCHQAVTLSRKPCTMEHRFCTSAMPQFTWSMTGICGGLLPIGWQATGHGVQSGFSSAAAAC